MADIITIPDDPNVFVHDINLDLHDEGYVEEVPLVQYDANKVYVRATIWNNGVRYSVPSTSIIALVATKPDNNGLFNQAGIDSEGRIIYKVTDETTSMYGNFDAQFRLYDTELVDGASVSRLKSSFKFRVYVAKSTLDDNTIISASEFNILTNLINSIGDLTNDVNDAVARANDVATQLETETLKIFKPAVATYSDLLTTYPNPENGWTVTVNGESPVVSYRYNGIEWVNLGIISSVDTNNFTDKNDKKYHIKLKNIGGRPYITYEEV